MTNKLRALSLVLLFIPALAYADIDLAGSSPTWTVYSFANADVLKELFVSIKGFMSDGSYRILAAFFALIGMLGGAVVAANSGNLTKSISPYIVMMMVLTIGFNEKSDVAIKDVVTPTGYPVVNDVPSLAVVPPAVIMTIGHKITEKIEQYFSLPSAMKISSFGAFNLGASMMNAMSTVEFLDPSIKATMANFGEDCILPSIASGSLSVNVMVNSQTLFGGSGYLKNVRKSLLTTVYDGTGNSVVLPCGPGGATSATTVTSAYYSTVSANNVYDYISQYVSVAGYAQVMSSFGVAASTPMYAALGGALTSAQTFMTDGAFVSPVNQTIAQAAAVNLLVPGVQQAAMMTGDSNLASSMAVAQAQRTQQSSWEMSAIVFRDVAGYLFSVAYSFIIVLMPFALLAFLLPGAGRKVGSNVIQLVVWLAMWEPMLAIVNNVISVYAANSIRGSALATTANFTVTNIGMIDQMTSRLLLVGSYLATFVPVIAWGVVKGGASMTNFVTGAISAAGASAAASSAVAGNLSLGQKSIDNMSMDQSNTMWRNSVGLGTPEAGLAGYGSNFNHNSAGISVAGAAKEVSASAAAAKEKGVTLKNSYLEDASTSQSRAIGAIAERAKQILHEGGMTTTYNSADQWQEQFSHLSQDSQRELVAIATSAVESGNIEAAHSILSEMGMSADGKKVLQNLSGLLSLGDDKLGKLMGGKQTPASIAKFKDGLSGALSGLVSGANVSGALNKRLNNAYAQRGSVDEKTGNDNAHSDNYNEQTLSARQKVLNDISSHGTKASKSAGGRVQAQNQKVDQYRTSAQRALEAAERINKSISSALKYSQSKFDSIAEVNYAMSAVNAVSGDMDKQFGQYQQEKDRGDKIEITGDEATGGRLQSPDVAPNLLSERKALLSGETGTVLPELPADASTGNPQLDGQSVSTVLAGAENKVSEGQTEVTAKKMNTEMEVDKGQADTERDREMRAQATEAKSNTTLKDAQDGATARDVFAMPKDLKGQEGLADTILTHGIGLAGGANLISGLMNGFIPSKGTKSGKDGGGGAGEHQDGKRDKKKKQRGPSSPAESSGDTPSQNPGDKTSGKTSQSGGSRPAESSSEAPSQNPGDKTSGKTSQSGGSRPAESSSEAPSQNPGDKTSSQKPSVEPNSPSSLEKDASRIKELSSKLESQGLNEVERQELSESMERIEKSSEFKDSLSKADGKTKSTWSKLKDWANDTREEVAKKIDKLTKPMTKLQDAATKMGGTDKFLDYVTSDKGKEFLTKHTNLGKEAVEQIGEKIGAMIARSGVGAVTAATGVGAVVSAGIVAYNIYDAYETISSLAEVAEQVADHYLSESPAPAPTDTPSSGSNGTSEVVPPSVVPPSSQDPKQPAMTLPEGSTEPTPDENKVSDAFMITNSAAERSLAMLESASPPNVDFGASPIRPTSLGATSYAPIYGASNLSLETRDVV